MRIAKEGIPFIIIAVVISAGVWILGGVVDSVVVFALAGALSLVTLWVVAFFRDPRREGPRGAHMLVCPADGKVIRIHTVNEPDYVGGQAVCISVFMNVFNVHVNRYPVNGTVEYRDYREGKFFNASLDKASVNNERMSLGILGPHGKVLVRQIAGLVARRIVTDHHPGATVHQGDRLGLIRFGSRVDTFVPPGIAVRVKEGDSVNAGLTVLGEWTS